MITSHLPNGLTKRHNEDKFIICSHEDALRYLKGIYTNYERFENNFAKKLKNLDALKKYFLDNYETTAPFSYEEAFKIRSEEFKALVFGSINISEMISNLGCKRLSVKGKVVSRKKFNENG